MRRHLAFLSLAAIVVIACEDPPTSPLGDSESPSAVILKPTQVMDLGTLGGEWSIAFDVNNRGVVVGIAGCPTARNTRFDGRVRQG